MRNAQTQLKMKTKKKGGKLDERVFIEEIKRKQRALQHIRKHTVL